MNLSTIISSWQDKPLQVTLFGSAARNEMSTDSDIDIFFLIEDNADDELYENISDLAIELYLFTGHDVRPLICEVSEVSSVSVFHSIIREGIHVYGDSEYLPSLIRTQESG